MKVRAPAPYSEVKSDFVTGLSGNALFQKASAFTELVEVDGPSSVPCTFFVGVDAVAANEVHFLSNV